MNNPSQDDAPAGQRPEADDTDKPGADQQEPSMEDILTSIRRILSEEGGEETGEARAVDVPTSLAEPVSTPETPPSSASPPPPEPTTEMGETGPGSMPETEFEPESEPERDIVLEDMESAPAEPEPDNVLVLTPQMRAPLVSPTAATASADVLNQLAKAILDRRDIAIGNRDVTLEGMVREMMRPLLKEWLDRNLPYLIERLVKKEIDLMVNRAERLED